MPTKTSRAPSSRRPRVLISAARLQRRVSGIGRSIARDYAGRRVVMVGVLRGAFMFLADLVRGIDLPITCDFMRLSSYHGTRSNGLPKLEFDISEPVEGRHVILVEDIVDTGATAAAALRCLKAKKPASLALCALLHKPSRGRVHVEIDYLGFKVPDKFVVGYGLDYNGRHRNLPYLGVIA